MAVENFENLTLEQVKKADRPMLYRMLLAKNKADKEKKKGHKGLDVNKLRKESVGNIRKMVVKAYGLDKSPETDPEPELERQEDVVEPVAEATEEAVGEEAPITPPSPPVIKEETESPAVEDEEAPVVKKKRGRAKKAATATVDLTPIETKLTALSEQVSQVMSSLYDVAEAVQLLSSNLGEISEVNDTFQAEMRSRFSELMALFTGPEDDEDEQEDD